MRSAIALVLLCGCGGNVFSADYFAQQLDASGEASADVVGDGSPQDLGDGSPPADGGPADQNAAKDAAGDVDAAEVSVDAGPEAATTCTPLPWRNFQCAGVGCLLSAGEACELSDGGSQCLTVNEACACAETYSCACIALGRPCSEEAGIVTVWGP